MTIYHFLSLNITEQADCIWQGKYLATRTEENMSVLLYRIDEFYAEVFYDIGKNKIERIKGFNANSHLAPYISINKHL